jgi:lysylphosphatidylglycerol synthetase-like protein (DUF2156 family)
MSNKIKKSEFFLKSLINALGTFIYIAAVAWVMTSGEVIFGRVSGFLAPLFILLLFVVSASVTGLLVLGKPILLYLDGFKKEAVRFLICTLGWLILFVFLIVAMLVLQF